MDTNSSKALPGTDELEAMAKRFAQMCYLGFPAGRGFDYSPLAEAGLLHLMLNNVGDPYQPGVWPGHTKDLERWVIDYVADLLHAPTTDRWGYLAGGASEATIFALYVARTRLGDPIVYHSTAAHESVSVATDLLRMPSVAIATDSWDQLNLDDLRQQLAHHRDRPAVVVATAGTTMTEAVDDVRDVVVELDRARITRRFIHVDAALAGLPLAVLDPTSRPGFDFGDGADSVAISGHKFLGTPWPSAALVMRAADRDRIHQALPYQAAEATITCSRNAHSALAWWYILSTWRVEGIADVAAGCRQLATDLVGQLTAAGWHAYRHRLGFTVNLATPPASMLTRWPLASQGGRSHIVCMPGVTRELLDQFVTDLRAAATGGVTVPTQRREIR